ncbi:MAG: hypothetical protein NXI15_15935 [Gammaproteobacteria bacterium]|nr:hypothetical protein [Gammaproteobacteria bacterium]
MSNTRQPGDNLERELHKLFRQLREAESQSLPEFPASEPDAFFVERSIDRSLVQAQKLTDCESPASALTTGSQTPNTAGDTFNPRAPMRATGALAAAVLVALLVQPGDRNPEDVYLDVMRNSNIMTDDMLMASPAIVPEQASFDDFFGEPDGADTDYDWH